MIYFQTRNDFIKSLNKDLKICEVGVFEGEFSEFILNEINPSELHLIDLFDGLSHSGDKDGKNIRHRNLNEVYEELKTKYVNQNVFIYKGNSHHILKKLPMNYFDLIYIDADHSYESVRLDLDLSHKKVKSGGIIAGHDYIKENFSGVYRAVNEFCLENNLKIDFLTKDLCPTYGIIKK